MEAARRRRLTRRQPHLKTALSLICLALVFTPAMLIGMDVLGTVSQLIIDFRRSEVYVLA